jgi:hypothetical protein
MFDEEWERKRDIAEDLLVAELDERGCPIPCPYKDDFCWPWRIWPECRLGREYLLESERREIKERRERYEDVHR